MLMRQDERYPVLPELGKHGTYGMCRERVELIEIDGEVSTVLLAHVASR